MSQNTIRKKPRRPHKFRFQLLSDWLLQNYAASKAADVGGGKGLLAYILNQNGWDVSVIDPFDQLLPHKFKDLERNKRIRLSQNEMKSIPRIAKPFEKEMAQDFDLLIGLHAHGSNMKIIQACQEYKKDFVLLPCCVIDEPIVKRPGVNWLESLIEYAQSKGLNVKKAELNFVGQSIIIYSNTYSKLQKPLI
jgi:hypothetical protein